MKRFIEGADRGQWTLLPECLDDWIGEDNPVRAIDAFVDALDLAELGFKVQPAETGRPSFHPSIHLKLYIYDYVNRVPSSRRLEREAGRNLEVIWLLGRLTPDDKVIADFRKDNGPAIRKVCAQFVELCRKLRLLTKASVAIDGSKFKAVNDRDKNFTRNKMDRRRKQLEESVARYLGQLDTADRQEPSEALSSKTAHLKEKIARIGEEIKKLDAIEKQMRTCPLKPQCTTGKERRITRWEHEHVLEAVQRRLDEHPEAMRVRRETAEHPFGTLKVRMGTTPLLMKTLPKVATEMALSVLAYNFTRVINIIGIKPLMAAITA
jgi:transposase